MEITIKYGEGIEVPYSRFENLVSQFNPRMTDIEEGKELFVADVMFSLMDTLPRSASNLKLLSKKDSITLRGVEYTQAYVFLDFKRTEMSGLDIIYDIRFENSNKDADLGRYTEEQVRNLDFRDKIPLN